MLAISNLVGFMAGGLPVINLLYSSDQANVSLFTAAGSPSYPCHLVVTINSGIYIYSSSTGSYALDTATGFAAGSIIRINNSGYIAGKGGVGGGATACWAPGGGSSNGSAPGAGGPAFRAQSMTGVIIEVNNLGEINGGGGGAACAASVLYWDGVNAYSAGGGGGGGGRCGANSAAGGGGGQVSWGVYAWGSAGGYGSRAGAGGAGSAGAVAPGTGGGAGAAGGGWGASGGGNGASGAYGYTETSGYYGGAAGGAAVVGNSYITWIANGTRNGSIS